MSGLMAVSCHVLLLHSTAHFGGWLSGLCYCDKCEKWQPVVVR